jgi:hypothetical protein
MAIAYFRKWNCNPNFEIRKLDPMKTPGIADNPYNSRI